MGSYGNEENRCSPHLGRAGACAEIDEKIAGHDLDALSAGKGRHGDHFTLRWVIGHLIEETSRHNGHLDIVRELVDGVKGG
ncbi:DUF664 domain-containing protein [Nonomuraea dietziae]|uniref:mycothiol transferase n=1 Tax=Nonomuraea dietziae TaxID=65515 RepID=UPI003F4DCE61